MFNIITSIYKPDRGDIYLKGARITGLAPHKICHMGLSRTFLLFKAFLKMSVLENVMVGSVYGRKHQARGARERALEALHLVELSEKKEMLAANITLSDRRLLKVAMALASKPVVTLLDEGMRLLI